MQSIIKNARSYQRLDQLDTTSPNIDLAHDGIERHQHVESGKKRTKARYLVWALSLAVSFVTGFALAKHHSAVSSCQESDLAWGPARSLANRHWHRFEGSFNSTSVFKGPPSDELDVAWSQYTHEWIDGTSVVLAATNQEMKESGNAPFPATVADLGEENGGGSMATLEMFHQLHCLNLLRKWTYVDYYRSRDYAWDGIQLREHTDHCIDILRQVLMCNGDIGLVMFHWVRGKDQSPYPDFSTMHRCRDPEVILQTAQAHAAPMVKKVTKAQGAQELPDLP